MLVTRQRKTSGYAAKPRARRLILAMRVVPPMPRKPAWGGGRRLARVELSLVQVHDGDLVTGGRKLLRQGFGDLQGVAV